jgi:heme A synthase
MIGLIVAAPALAALLPPMGVPTGGLLYASPLTAVHALTTEPTGSTPRMEPLEWWAGIGPACLGLVLWAGALVTGGGRADRDPTRSPAGV